MTGAFSQTSCIVRSMSPAVSIGLHPTTPAFSVVQTSSRVQRRRRSFQVRAGLFGWGKDPEKEKEKEEAYLIQQEVLKRRRSNGWQKAVSDRRAEVRKYSSDPEYKAKVDEERRKRKVVEDPKISPFNIIIPLPPFGLPEYDDGERFDLKVYQTGEVDEDADFRAQFKRTMQRFGFGKKSSDDPGQERGKK